MDIMALLDSSLLFGLSFLLYRWWKYGLVQQAEVQRLGHPMEAVVREYQKEYVRVAGTWQWMDYPYVEYTSDEGEVRLEKLKYAQHPGRPFSIGEKVTIVRYSGVLYYQEALNSRNLLFLALSLGMFLWSLVMIIKSLLNSA